MIQPRRSSEAYDGSYGDFCFYLFSFFILWNLGSRDFSNIDCTGSGSWWKWPWNKLDLSTSYLCSINITLEIIIIFGLNEVMGRRKKRSMNLSVLLHTLCCRFVWNELCGRWLGGVPPHDAIRRKSIFLWTRAFMVVYQRFLFCYCFLAFRLFWNLSFITHKNKSYKSIILPESRCNFPG